MKLPVVVGAAASFEEQMDGFFCRYSKEARALVDANPFYQRAAKEGDAVKAQELACELLSGNVETPREGRERRRIFKTFEQF